MTSLLTAAETANPAVRGLFEGSTRVTWTNAEDPKESVVVDEPFLKLACHIGAHTNFLEDGLRESFAQDGERRSASLGRDAVFKKATVITVLPEYVIGILYWLTLPRSPLCSVLLEKGHQAEGQDPARR